MSIIDTMNSHNQNKTRICINMLDHMECNQLINYYCYYCDTMDQSYVDDGMSSDIHIIIIDLWLELLPHTHANNVHCLYIYIYKHQYRKSKQIPKYVSSLTCGHGQFSQHFALHFAQPSTNYNYFGHRNKKPIARTHLLLSDCE